MSVTVLGLPLCPGPCAPGRGLTGTNESNTTDFMKTSCQVYTLHTAHYTQLHCYNAHTAASNKDNIAPHPPKATRHRAKYLIKMPLHPPKNVTRSILFHFKFITSERLQHSAQPPPGDCSSPLPAIPACLKKIPTLATVFKPMKSHIFITIDKILHNVHCTMVQGPHKLPPESR